MTAAPLATTRLIPVLLAVLMLALTGLTVPAAASASSATCQSIVAGKATDLPPDTPFNGGIPFQVTIGADVDFSPEAGGVHLDVVSGDESDFFHLSLGRNDLLVHAGVTGPTLVRWDIPLLDGTRCTGRTEARVIVSEDQPHVTFHTPAWGEVFSKGQKVVPQFDCDDNGYHVSYCAVNGIGTWNDGPMPHPNPHPELDTSTPGRHWVVGYAQDQPNDPCTCAKFGYTTQLYYVEAGPASEPVTYEVTLQQRSYPRGDWVELNPSEPIVAGNVVRAVIDISNNSDVPQRVQVNASVERSQVTDGTIDVTVAPRESHSQAMTIETTDLAWNTWDSSPHLDPIQLRLQTITKDKVDIQTFPFTVRPRPVILVHGWKSYAESSWGTYQQILTAAHPLLKGYAVGDGQFPGTMNTNGGGTGDSTARTGTVAENAAQEALYIEGVRRATNAWQVDVLAHSMGGLISRYYLQELMPMDAGRPAVNRLIQMGTPNRGSQLADMMMAFGAGGSTTTIPFYPASMHLTTSWVDGVFNPRVTETHGVPISNLVGTDLPLLMAPLLPHLYGDGIVPAYSARWNLADTQDSPYDFHTAMTESVDDFHQYVLPRLVRPSTDTRSDVGGRGTRTTAQVMSSATPDAGSQARSVRSVQLDADSVVEIPFLVEDAPATGVMTTAKDVVLEIFDADGVLIARSQDETAKDDGRAVLVAEANGYPAGAGTLRVTDTSGTARDVDLLSYVAGSRLALTPGVVSGPNTSLATGGMGVLTARFTQGDDTVTGATVTATVTDAPGLGTLTLYDDGNHGDNTAGDGTYAVPITGVSMGDHAAVVRARSRFGERITATVLSVDANGNLADLPSGEPMHRLDLEADPGGSVAISPEQQQYAEGDVVTLTPFPDPDRRSAGWTVDGTSRPAGPLVLTMRADRTVTAHFEPDLPSAPTLAWAQTGKRVTVPLGDTFDRTVRIIDADAGDHWTATLDAGAGPRAVTVDGARVRVQVPARRIGTRMVRVTVTDSAALTAQATTKLRIEATPRAARKTLRQFARLASKHHLPRSVSTSLRASLALASRHALAAAPQSAEAALVQYGKRLRRARSSGLVSSAQARKLEALARHAHRNLVGSSANRSRHTTTTSRIGQWPS